MPLILDLARCLIVDLTHLIDPNIPTWSGSCGFHAKQVCDYKDCKTKTKFRVQKFEMNAGIGTHMDAPSHCVEGGSDISSIPTENLCVPCCIIDVSKKAHKDYFISKEDVENYEKENGKIPEGAFVAGYTGWSKHWSNPSRYRSPDDKGKVHCPGFSLEAAQFLLDRKIVGIGIDSLSPDGSNDDFPVHQAILGAGRYIVENLNNLQKMPKKSAYVILAPLKIKDGTESPIRALGVVNKQKK